MFKYSYIVVCVLLSAVSAKRRGFGYARASVTETEASPIGLTLSSDNHAVVLSAASSIRSDGFDYHSESSNGASSAASGDEHGRIYGAFQWISPEGKHVSLSYVADENGYRPQGALLPTPPPIPQAILKSLIYNENHPHEEEQYDQHNHHHLYHQYSRRL